MRTIGTDCHAFEMLKREEESQVVSLQGATPVGWSSEIPTMVESTCVTVPRREALVGWRVTLSRAPYLKSLGSLFGMYSVGRSSRHRPQRTAT